MPLGNQGPYTSKNPWKSLKIKTLLKISKILAFIICRNRSSPMYLWLKWCLLVLDQSRLLSSGEGIILIKCIAGFYAYAPNLWERLVLEMHERSGYAMTFIPLCLGDCQPYYLCILIQTLGRRKNIIILSTVLMASTMAYMSLNVLRFEYSPSCISSRASS